MKENKKSIELIVVNYHTEVDENKVYDSSCFNDD